MKNLFFILFFTIPLLNYSQVNNFELQTLKLYNQQNWKGLIKVAERAQNQKASSYKIDYRLALAYYYSHNYFDSASAFENLMKTYQDRSDIILEYLYYSYLFSGRQQDALLVAKDFPFHLQQKIGVKKTEIIDYLSLEGGLKISSEKEFGIQNLNYLNAGLGNQFGYKVKMQHAFTNISQNYIDLDYTQKEYYTNLRIQMAKGLTLIPAFHYINTSEKNQPSHGGGSFNPVEQKSQLFYLGIKKQWNRFSISPSFIYSSTKSSEIGNFNNFQYGLQAGYSLKATRNKLWLGAGADFVNNNSDLVWNVKMNYNITPKAFIYIRYLNANTTNFAVEDAMYFFNSVSTLIDNSSITFGYFFSPKFLWYINYQRENAKDLEYAITFHYNTIITGIKFDL